MLKSGATNIPLERALDHVHGYAVSLDMTRRDLQGEMKKQGRPWEIGKAFERSAPVGPVYPVGKTGHLERGSITLKVNGELRQEGDIKQMMWKVPEMISYLSEYHQSRRRRRDPVRYAVRRRSGRQGRQDGSRRGRTGQPDRPSGLTAVRRTDTTFEVGTAARLKT